MVRWQFGLLLAALLGLVVGPTDGVARRAARPRAALIGNLESERQGCLFVIGGVARGRGWLSSERARGLARLGDEVTVGDLQTVPIGRGRLTSQGRLGSEQAPSQWGMRGLWYDVQLDARAEKRSAQAGKRAGNAPSLLAAWHSPSSPAPRWVRGAVLDPRGGFYRKVIADWLATRGVSPEVVQTIDVSQVVKADVNRDGRDEVFLAFHTPDVSFPTRAHSTATSFSYLIMRYVPPHSRRVRTVVIEDRPNSLHALSGLCDLDGDGWAEVVTTSWATDACGTTLHHWTGRLFQAVEGWGGGV
jgi:hypothetical protein